MHRVLTIFAGSLLFFVMAAAGEDGIVTEPEKCLLLGMPHHFGYLGDENRLLMSNGGGIYALDPDSGRQVWRRLTGGGQRGTCIGQRKILGWSEEGVFLLDIHTGKELWSRNDPQCGPIESASLSPDEKQVLVRGSRGCLLYTPATHSKVALPKPENGWISGWLPGGEKLLFEKQETVADKTTQKWLIVDGSSGGTTVAWERDLREDSAFLSLSSNGEMSEATSSEDEDTSSLKIRDATTGKVLREFTGLPGKTIAMYWLRDAKRLYYTCKDRSKAYLADSMTGASLMSFSHEGHTFDLVSYEDDAGNGWIFSRDDANNRYVWPMTPDATPRKVLDGVRIAPGYFHLLTLDRNYLFTTSQQEDNNWRYSLYTLEGIQKAAGWTCEKGDYHWSNQLISLDLNHLVNYYNTKENDPDWNRYMAYAVYAKDRTDVIRKSDDRPLAISPDGRYLAVQDEDTSACLCELETGKSVQRVEVTFPAEWKDYCPYIQATFSADGKRVAFNTTRSLEIVEIAEEFPKWPMSTGEYAGYSSSAPSFSPDGKRLLLDGINSAFLFDADTGELLHTFEETERFVERYAPPNGFWNSLARSAEDWMGAVTDRFKRNSYVQTRFADNGAKAITYCSGQVIRVWDTESGELLHTIHTGLPEKRNSRGEIRNDIIFSPGNGFALCYNTDGYGPGSLWSILDGALQRRYEFPTKENSWMQAAIAEDGAEVYLTQNENLYQWPGIKQP